MAVAYTQVAALAKLQESLLFDQVLSSPSPPVLSIMELGAVEEQSRRG